MNIRILEKGDQLLQHVSSEMNMDRIGTNNNNPTSSSSTAPKSFLDDVDIEGENCEIEHVSVFKFLWLVTDRKRMNICDWVPIGKY